MKHFKYTFLTGLCINLSGYTADNSFRISKIPEAFRTVEALHTLPKHQVNCEQAFMAIMDQNPPSAINDTIRNFSCYFNRRLRHTNNDLSNKLSGHTAAVNNHMTHFFLTTEEVNEAVRNLQEGTEAAVGEAIRVAQTKKREENNEKIVDLDMNMKKAYVDILLERARLSSTPEYSNFLSQTATHFNNSQMTPELIETAIQSIKKSDAVMQEYQKLLDTMRRLDEKKIAYNNYEKTFTYTAYTVTGVSAGLGATLGFTLGHKIAPWMVKKFSTSAYFKKLSPITQQRLTQKVLPWGCRIVGTLIGATTTFLSSYYFTVKKIPGKILATDYITPNMQQNYIDRLLQY